MRRTAHRPSLALVLALGVLLTVPEVRWCQLAWADLEKCLAACPTPVSCTAIAAGGCERWESCDPATQRPASSSCESFDGCESVESCPAAPTDDDETAPAGRAWCLAETPAGTLPHGPDFGDPLAVPAATVVDLAVPTGPAVWRGHEAIAVAIAPGHLPHARPPVRAPPIA
jgi:hypothetical protein